MTETTLSFYLVSQLEPIARAFGSGDTGLPARVLAAAGAAIDDLGPPQAVEEGLARIIGNAEIASYHWPTALAIEALFAAFGAKPGAFASIVLPGYTEDYSPPLKALRLPVLSDAMDVLAFGQVVQLPLPVRVWDDVTGQAYFDTKKRDDARQELDAIGSVEAAAVALADRGPDAFGDLDAPDLTHLLKAMKAVLSQAANDGASVAVFRHGGV